MNQRMTDEAVANARRDAGAALDLDCECDPDAHEPGCFEHEAGTAFVALETDHDRARSEEARLLEENRRQAEEIERLRGLLGEADTQRAHIAKVAEWREGQVKALVDALERTRDLLPKSFANAARITIDAALRLAGRVK